MHARLKERTSVALRAVSFEVAYDKFIALRFQQLQSQGSIIAVIGHNGAGKSTLLKSVLNLLPRKFGSIEVLAPSESGAFVLKPEQHMAFCPETGSVFADISVESYVRLWCRLKIGDADYYKREGQQWVERLKLAPLLPKLGRELSKGQCRRVQTAIGFFCRPRLFLLDEPFDGLDVQKTNVLADIIYEQSVDMSFIITSHRMDVVERMADSLIVLKEGELFSSGSLHEVCHELARQSYRLNGVRDLEHMVLALREHFPDLVINRIGDEIRLTGLVPELRALFEFVYSVDGNGGRLEAVRPGLVDAMSYHLREDGRAR